MWNLRLSLMALGKKSGKPKAGLAVQFDSKGNSEAFIKTHQYFNIYLLISRESGFKQTNL